MSVDIDSPLIDPQWKAVGICRSVLNEGLQAGDTNPPAIDELKYCDVRAVTATEAFHVSGHNK